ncbi:GNAT family N-acetyltransferase [Paraherbaspirillum soli]|uniref:GNAT family N-acetyltransferase n=1 Tax=Paraherbaspirillum soli TaxID=631222 RepID=A0ABW0M806_9BURK
MTIILETDRLILRRLTCDDAEFYLELVNDPSWLRFIGDKGVKTLDAAREAILSGPVAMHERMGFSFYLTELKEGGVPIGICGLVKRDSLDDVDIGFAFLPRFWGKGYAYEAASAVMAYGRNTFGFDRIVAIASPDNHSSIKLIEKIGLKFEQMLPLFRSDGRPTSLFACDFRESFHHIAGMTPE